MFTDIGFNWFNKILRNEDRILAREILGKLRQPDLVIAPNGEPYLARWHVIPRNPVANVYFHIQIASDPERPLHDHPWDNMSAILSGGYDEIFSYGNPLEDMERHRQLRKGQTQWRAAEEAHRLILPKHIPYTMTLFTTGPKRRKWGFWFKDGWRPQEEVIVNLPDGRSIFKGE